MIEGENQKKVFIEVKKTPQVPANYQDYAEVKKIFKGKPPELIVCHMEGRHPMKNVIPVVELKEKILACL